MTTYINRALNGITYAEVTDDDIHASVVNFLNQTTVKIGGVEYGYGRILAALDPIHLNELVNDQIDYALKNGELEEIPTAYP